MRLQAYVYDEWIDPRPEYVTVEFNEKTTAYLRRLAQQAAEIKKICPLMWLCVSYDVDWFEEDGEEIRMEGGSALVDENSAVFRAWIKHSNVMCETDPVLLGELK